MKRYLAPLVLVLAVTGCGAQASTPPAQPSAIATPTKEAPKVLKSGAFTFTNATGATGTIQAPAAPNAEIEGLRKLVGVAEPIAYLTAHVDNRAGTVGVNMYGVSIFTTDGQELKYASASNYIDKLRPSGAPAATYNQFIDASNKYGEFAPPKSTKDFVLIGPAVPAEFVAMTVYPTGGSDPVDAEAVNP